MPILQRGCVVLILIAAAACGSGNPSPSAPTTPGAAPTPPPFAPAPLSTFHVTGIATDDDGKPAVGATVTILNTSALTTTDGRGFYSLDFDAARSINAIGWVKAESAGHDTSYYYLIPASGTEDIPQDIRLYRIKRINAGDSMSLTVARGDTSCGDSDQFVCRTLHIVASSDGLLTIGAAPTPSATNAGLEVFTRPTGYRCCSLTTSIPVTAGTEVVANVGMWWTSTASQSFTLDTSMARP